MASQPKYQKVVLDAGVAIRMQRPEALGEECFITPQVLGEIKDPRARFHLQTFTVPLKPTTPTEKDIAWVRAFAAKTGDLGFLSDNDIGIIALAYMLQRQTGNVKNLKMKPADVTIVGKTLSHSWAPPKPRTENEEESAPVDKDATPAAPLAHKEMTEEEMEDLEAQLNAEFEEEQRVEREAAKLDALAKEANDKRYAELEAAAAKDGEEGEVKTAAPPAQPKQVIVEVGDKEVLEELDGEDCGQWVTPENFKHFGSIVDGEAKAQGTIKDEVALVSTDYSVQNVAIQMGLAVATVHGMRIRSVKLWAQICSGCRYMERDTTKQFCKGCGYPNFRRVPLIIDQKTGEVRVHDNPNRKFNLRGINYSIPKPKGGRNNEIIFCEAQLHTNNRQWELQAARKKYAQQLTEANPFNDNNYADKGWWSAAKANIGGKNNLHKTAPKFTIGLGAGNPNSNRFQKKKNTSRK